MRYDRSDWMNFSIALCAFFISLNINIKGVEPQKSADLTLPLGVLIVLGGLHYQKRRLVSVKEKNETVHFDGEGVVRFGNVSFDFKKRIARHNDTQRQSSFSSIDLLGNLTISIFCSKALEAYEHLQIKAGGENLPDRVIQTIDYVRRVQRDYSPLQPGPCPQPLYS
jgi:hypothetical protein